MAARKRVAIVQSSYIPWKGYFDLIRAADEFILLDDVQFTRRDWRNRNRIKAQHGVAWLTIPVVVKGRYSQSIQETVVADPRWGVHHWNTLRANYARSPWFDRYAPQLEPLFLQPSSDRLSAINRAFIEAITGILGARTVLRWSSEYAPASGRNERLISLCHQAGATEYLSGPSARDYLDEGAFRAAGIQLTVVDYSGYPEYAQPYPPFDHHVSVLDLIFCTGPRALEYMKSF